MSLSDRANTANCTTKYHAMGSVTHVVPVKLYSISAPMERLLSNQNASSELNVAELQTPPFGNAKMLTE